jgi:hypothetical protein
VKIVAKEVEMVAVFDKQGIPKPLRFKIDDDDGLYVVKVDQVVSTESIRPAGMEALVFRCQSVINGIEKQYELVYRIKPHRWELYKM